MLKSGELLFVAGVPCQFPDQDLYNAMEGRMGALLAVVSAKDGTVAKSLTLPAAPAWDGMAAADKRLYVTLKDRTVVCLGGE